MSKETIQDIEIPEPTSEGKCDLEERVRAIQNRHARANAKKHKERERMLNRAEKIIHGKINGTIEHSYNNRREISHLERLFQDRVKGIVGLKIESIEVDSMSLLLHCTNNKEDRYFRVYLTHSRYGDTFRLSVTEVIYRKAGKLKKIEDTKKHLEAEIENAKAAGNEEKVGDLLGWMRNLEREERKVQAQGN
jgi:hypothetical protein